MAAGTKYACRLPQDSILVNVPGSSKNVQDNANIRLGWKVSDVTQIDFVSSFTSLRRKSHQDGSIMNPYPFNVNYVFRSNDIDPATGLYKSAYGVNGCTTNLCTYPVNDTINTVTDSNFVSRVQELQFKQTFDKFRYVSGLFWMHEKNRNFSANENLVGNTAFASPTFSNFFSQVNRTIDSKALFAQADWDFAPTWTATLGGRYTRDRRTDADGVRWDGATGTAVQNAYYQGAGVTPSGDNLALVAGQPGWHPHTGLDLNNNMGVYALGEAAAAKPFGRPVFPLAPNDATWSKTTWRAGLKKDIDKSNMVYASLATGYKAGGFNDIIDYCGGKPCAAGPSPDLRFPVWQPETVTNLEFGYKGRLTDKLTTSVALFYQKYNNLQQSINVAGALRQDPSCTPATDATCDPVAKTSIATINTTTNVGRLTIPGAEVEWTYRPVRGFTWTGFASVINARMHDYNQLTDTFLCAQRAETGLNPCPVASTSNDPLIKGKRLLSSEGKTPANTPRRTFASTLSQRVELANGWSLVPRVSMRWQDKIYFDLTNLEDPNFGRFQKAYAKYDAGMRIADVDDRFSFDLAVRNLSDVRARTSATNGPGGTDGAIMASYIEPRVYSFRMTVKY
jgi:iron complex outermembrane receptor protein